MEKCEKYELQRKEKEIKNFHLQEAKRKREEEIAKLKMEEQRRKQEVKNYIFIILIRISLLIKELILGKGEETSTCCNHQAIGNAKKI